MSFFYGKIAQIKRTKSMSYLRQRSRRFRSGVFLHGEQLASDREAF